jgi:ribosomal protein S18 acetylase RimI-like enzyme
MKFQPFNQAHLPELMSWFRTADELRTWGDPPFRFPFTDATFREDANFASLPTWSLVEDGRLAAFGQCYLRVGRCHFGRVAVSPKFRSRGHGTMLIREMASWGSAEFSVGEYSLFVIASNLRAIALYRRLGFSEMPYPEPSPELETFIYMVATRLSA